MKAFLIFPYLVALAGCGQRVDLVLSARDIPKDFWWGQPNAFLKVYYKFNSEQNWIKYGETSVSKSNPNPNWPQAFTFDYVNGSSQAVMFDLWDKGNVWDSYIATVQSSLTGIVDSAIHEGGEKVERFFSSGKGRLLLKVRTDGTIP